MATGENKNLINVNITDLPIGYRLVHEKGTMGKEFYYLERLPFFKRQEVKYKIGLVYGGIFILLLLLGLIYWLSY